MKNVGLGIGLALLSWLAIAQDNSQDNSALPIDLEADSGYYDQQSGRAVYEGNVRVSQGIATIWAHKITIFMQNSTAERIEADGNDKAPVRFEYQGEQQPITGQGNKAVYRVIEKTVTLSGQAVVTQGKDLIKGEKLTYQLADEIIKGSRVRMTLQPSKTQAIQ